MRAKNILQQICRAAFAAALAMGAAMAHAAPIKDAFQRQSAQVTDHVWLIYRTYRSSEPPFEGNVEVFEQSDGLVVVDAGGSPLSGRHVVAEIKKLSRKPVKYLVYTHHHGDHNLGAGALLAAWPQLRILSTQATRDNMTGSPMDYIKTYSEGYQGTVDFAAKQLERTDLSEAMRRNWQHVVDAGPSMVAAYKDLKAYPAQLTFADRILIPDKDVPIEVRFLGRANTDGDAVVWAPKQRALATGDIVVHPSPYASASFPTDWIATLKALEGFDFAHLVPGHGKVQTDTAYVERVISALRDVRAQVAPLAAQGLTLEEVHKRTNFEGLIADFSGGDPWEAFAFKNFFLGAIVSNAYKEARGEPIVQGEDGG